MDKKQYRFVVPACVLESSMKIRIPSSRQALSFLDRTSSPSKHEISYFFFFTVLGIHDILMRIRIRGSVPMTNGSGSNLDSLIQ
jgi:hypothetical protein